MIGRVKLAAFGGASLVSLLLVFSSTLACGSGDTLFYSFNQADQSIPTIFMQPGTRATVTATLHTDIPEPTVVAAAESSAPAVVDVISIDGQEIELLAVEEGEAELVVSAGITYGADEREREETLQVIVAAAMAEESLIGLWRRDTEHSRNSLWLELQADHTFVLSRGEDAPEPGLEECGGTWMLEGFDVIFVSETQSTPFTGQARVVDDLLDAINLQPCGLRITGEMFRAD